MFLSLNTYEIVLVECKRMFGIIEFATSSLAWGAVMRVICTGRRGWGRASLTITAREINNQVSLRPLPFSILGLIKNSSVTTLQLSRSERVLENLCFSLTGPGIKKKKIPRLNLIFMLSSR